MNRLKRGDFEGLKRPQDQFAFTFFGGMSRKSFRNGQELFDWLQHYKALSDYPDLSWEHFILYRVYPPGAWEELGGGLTYRLRRGWRGRRDKRGRRVVGHRATLTYEQVLEKDRARKREARKSPEFKAGRAAYMRKFRKAQKAKREKK